MVSTLMGIPGYQIIEEIYNGARTLVYRGYREIDSLPVVMKVLKNPYPSFSELLSFRNQYTITKNLHSPLIVETYSLELYQNGYVLILEDFGGISLEQWQIRETQISLQQFSEIAIALCDTLDILYQERIIHKDIKLSNILINPETKQVKLIDFSIASLLPRETQTLIKTNVLEGTLAYISPEQTGRMNRVIDYRTDFYSLGVTFYKLLTGELPFAANDPMEIVHCHIAKIAPLAHEINPKIPPILSAIVSKLMAKNAEDRYQSALGLKYDLEQCLSQLQATGKIESFPIASRDVCDRFIIPDKLYGREAEVSTLLQAFERVSQGATEMMLVAGFSGIGKTVVVNEVHKPIVRQRGYFIKGKFDQFNRNIPFSAFVQAFRNLMGQLLTESDTQLQHWKTQILAALGENAQVIVELIPELEQIIGAQPPAPKLSGTAAQNRFNLLFQKFIQVFSIPAHPLVMFVDDLQWADSASLNLIQLLMSESQTVCLLLLGAYRDNEVFAAHPLILTLNEMEKTGAKIHTMTLQPLNFNSLNHLISDTLHAPTSVVKPLTELVMQKTQGNPFFATQFLKALHQDQLITFDWGAGHWQCDIVQVRDAALTDDVVEFMAQQLQKLPAATQEILKLAACIGNEFDLKTLALVSQESIVETATCLWNALQSGLILPQTEIYKFFVGAENQGVNQDNGEIFIYKFLHDRVQQAAYSLIPEDQKQTTHVKIGRLLWSNTPEVEIEEQVFAIANQLNIGVEQFREPQERHQLSRLNFIAGKKAKASTAYNAALAYLKISIDLLPTNPWQSDYDFTLSLYNEATEASYLSGELDLMENFAQEVLRQAKAILDTAKVYEVKIESSTIQSQFLAAIDTAMQFLRPIGIEFPPEPTDEDFFLGSQEIQALLSDKTVAELADLPEMQQPELRAALRVLVKVDIPAYLAKPQLHRLLVLKKVPLSIKYGNTSASAFVYSGYGLMLSGQSNSIPQGYEFGQLALQLLSKFSNHEYEARVLVVVHGFITHWKEPLTATLKPLLQAYARGLEIGDLAFACHGASVYCYHAYAAGQELTTLANELAIYSAALAKIHKQATLNYHNIYHQIVLNLIEPTDAPWELVGSVYDEKSTLVLNEQISDPNSLWHFCVNKLMLCYVFQVLDLAVEYAIKAKQYSGSGYALPNISLLNFYDSLVQLALFPTASPTQQPQILQQVAENQQIMQQWANYAPMNQLHRFYLVEAEKHRVLGDKAAAIEFYDRAISQAKANGYIQEEGLANELAAKFYLVWEKEKVAAAYMQEAYYCYARWGAKAKVADLEKHYPQLLKPIIEQKEINLNPWETIISLTLPRKSVSTQSDTTSTSISDALDLTSVLKAAQTISSNIELDALITNLTQIILQNSGADKSVLILNQDDVLQIRAITSIPAEINSPQTTISTQLLDDCQDIPRKIINYVKNTQQRIVINNCQTDIPGLIAEYMLRYQPQSILCTPIINQGNLIGILYIESRAAAGVFTEERLQVIQILSAQAAIALENARLYQQIQQAMEKALLNQISIDQTTVSVWWIEPDGRIFYVNDAACRGLGYSRDEIIGKYVSDISPVFPQELWAEHWQAICEQGSFTAESYHKHKSGKIYPVEVNVNYVKFKDKEYNFVFTKDISDAYRQAAQRKQAEAEIQQKSQELTEALHNLQQANLQIVQNEKMSALGNLVAGVAHEMNNPLGFISATLQQTKPVLADIFEHLRLYQETLLNPGEEIIEHAEEIDLDYTLEDLPKMLDAMVMACDRLKNISISLRTFSRADKDYKVPFNLHEGIDSTILILKHRLKANEQRPAIEVVTNYSDLPQIECFPGQLNQVFMNILANAIDALDESNTGKSFAEIVDHPNRINITTLMTDKFVKISIADNGKGMSESVKQKIFDHLFTTKGVGKGTGLGLAIAKQIVEDTHGGKLSCNSVLGEGTEFMIEIPV
ncbi:ATP-binding sensor histidine kinase [Aliinostoc sp. HNIBRCY26]|uniref:ATP-binding sensor histidine kinase n=1 Tax=Aliinostoc sp. HNIBRCY26 TaxID=3418997 RepID=UPI003CFBCA06